MEEEKQEPLSRISNPYEQDIIFRNINQAFIPKTFIADLLCDEDQERLNTLMDDIALNYKGKKSDLKKAKKAQGPSPFVFKPLEKQVFNQIETELLKSDIYQKHIKFEKKWKLKPGDKVINQVREDR